MTSKDPRSIRAMFGSISGTYDLLNRVLTAGWDARWRRRAAAAIVDARAAETAGGEHERVLDLGVGTADLSLALLGNRAFRGRIVGIDFALPMLRLAKKKAPSAAHLSLAQGDALALPFRAASFDAAMAAFAIRNFASLPAALAECRRVVKPGGRVVILEFFRPERLAAPLRAYLRAVVPTLGRAISGHASAYRYLRDSQEGFVTLPEAVALFEASGFRIRRTERLFPGFAHLLLLDAPSDLQAREARGTGERKN